MPLHLGYIGIGMLLPDAFARYVTGQLMQFQCDGQALLAGHAPVAFDLFVECALRIHFSFANSASSVFNSALNSPSSNPTTCATILPLPSRSTERGMYASA